MKWFVRVAVAIALVLVALVVIGVLLPKDYAVQRSIVIAAPVEAVHRHVGDLERWAAWEPWRDADPSIEITLGEQTTGVGASQSWTDESGGGRLVFTAVDPQQGIAYDLAFGEDDAMQAQATMAYDRRDQGTEVTWTMRGELPDPVFGGYLVLLFEGALEQMFQEGLAALKTAVEQDVASDDPGDAPPAAAAPLTVGDRLPALRLHDHAGEPIDLRAAVAEQPAVLVFYRGGWCPYCNTHLSELAQGHDQIAATGWQVIGISPDRPEELATTRSEQDLPYRLLSDADASAIRAFGLAFTVDEATRETYRGYGIDLEAASGHDHYQLPHPAVYLVDREGVIRYAHHDEDYKQRLRLVQVLSAIGMAEDAAPAE